MSIAYDNGTGVSPGGTAATTTVSHTGTGSNLIWFAGCYIGNSELVTGVTCDGSAMTFLCKINIGGDDTELYYITGISAGTKNIVYTKNGTGSGWECIILTYTGVAQSTSIDTSLGQKSGSSNPQTLNLTSTTDNCWMMMMSRGTQSYQTTSTGTHRVDSADTSFVSLDSGGVIHPAGSSSLAVTQSPAGFAYQVGCMFKPGGAAPSANGNFFLVI